MNLIPFLNLGISEGLKRMQLNLLSRTVVTDDNGKTTGYRANILVIEDRNRYVKRDGEIIEGPNNLQTFNIQVHSSNIPKGNNMVPNVQLVNPRIVSNYATTQAGSTFAQIHSTIECDDVRIPANNVMQRHSLKNGGDK